MKNHTKIGISSYSYSYAVGFPGFAPERPLNAFGLVEKATRLKVPVVQIADNCPLGSMNDKELERLYAFAVDRGIVLEVGTRGILTEHLERYIRVAHLLRSPILRVVIDTKEHRPKFEEVIVLLKKALPLLERNNIVLGIENHDRFRSEVFANIVETLDSPWVGIVLDTVNSFACEENSGQVLETLCKYTVNLHVKDYRIDRIPNGMGLMVVGTIAGQGFLDIPHMVNTIKEKGRGDFSSILELWMPAEATMEKTLEKENFWVEQSVAYLKDTLASGT